MAKQLLVLSGPDEGRSFPLHQSDTLLLGRSRATGSHLIDSHVSRVHCQVQCEGEKVTVRDFDSAGGTWVNGKRVNEQELKPGDILRIGNTRIQYTDVEETSTPTVAYPTKQEQPKGWQDHLTGQTFSHYRIETLLAKGHNGYLFHGRDTDKNIPVTMKVLSPDFSQDDHAVKHFVEIMKSVMPLRHPNLLSVYAAGKSEGFCWVAMEYFLGESLAAVIGRIETTGMLDWRQVLRLAIYVSRGLKYAHGEKIIHGNVTPSNILLGKRPSDTKLTDLMFAKAMEGDVSQEVKREFHKDVPYMSLERLRKGGKIDARSDVYSLGATLYAMFTGQPPFHGKTVGEVVDKIRNEEAPPLADQFLGIPPEFEQIVTKMLAPEPRRRYQSSAELLDTLEQFAETKGVDL